MQVQIEDIKVKKRVRKETGDIQALAESMKIFGQINPITITKDNLLVAGERRLMAAKLLGWHTINASVVDFPDKLARLEYEVEENVQRREFTPQEEAEATKRIYRLKNPSFFRRVWNAIVKFFRRFFNPA